MTQNSFPAASGTEGRGADAKGRAADNDGIWKDTDAHTDAIEQRALLGLGSEKGGIWIHLFRKQ